MSLAVAPGSVDEERLCAALADVLGREAVSSTSDFFDDLDADSMVMAHFCARLRKQPELPSVSIKDVYEHRNIRSLAAALPTGNVGSDPAGSRESAPEVVVEAPVEPIGRTRYFLCGVMQALMLLVLTTSSALVTSRGYDWISASTNVPGTYLRSFVWGGAVFLGLCLLPVVAKWTLVGRWKPGEVRIWSLKYVRFWLVKLLIQRTPLVFFAGTPIYVFYLRALGAKIGPGVLILSRNVPVCTDLITIGANAVIRKDAFFTGYRAHRGLIQMGPITLGRDTFVGELTVLDIDTRMADGAQLGHVSSLHSGQVIPAGEHRQGSPARQTTEVDYTAVAATDGVRPRGTVYSMVQLLILFGVTVPVGVGGLIALADWQISLADLVGDSSTLRSEGFYRDTLIISAVLALGFPLVRLAFVGVVPRLLNRVLEPDIAYPLYGFRYFAHRGITRLTNVRFFTNLFGDSSYVVHYLRWLGYDVSFEEQTGANFGLNVRHENPYHVSVGPGTMIADGFSIMNADYSSTSFRISPARIGSHSFVGNQVGYPAQSCAGENVLLASKVMVPVDGDRREGVGFLGSPSFEIPRLVMRDRKFDALKEGDEFSRRLSAKNKHNLVTMGLLLLSRWGLTFLLVMVTLAAARQFEGRGAVVIIMATVLGFVIRTIYRVLVERASIGFGTLRPLYCSIYDREAWRIERFWKLSFQPVLLDGTPFKSIVWRLLGVRMGKRVFDDGCVLIEKTMITIGDDCSLNVASVVQPHSQEDGTFKSDNVVIGTGCTLGVASLVHYGVTMGDGASLAPAAFLMKGTEVLPHTRWADNPAREVGDRLPVEFGGSSAPTGDEAAGEPSQEAAIGPADGGAEHWSETLLAGGFTASPRWALEPVIGVGEHQEPIEEELLAALNELTEERGLPLRTVALAAHARVLAAMTGEEEITIGYVCEPGGAPLPCRLKTDFESWGALLEEARRVEHELRSRRFVPGIELGPDLHLTRLPFEIVFDPTDGRRADGTVADDDNAATDVAPLQLMLARHGPRPALRFVYRTDVLDDDGAARIAGYHLTALGFMASDPDADHRRLSLLSADELRFQLEGLAGPRRDLPDRRFHELFEDRVRAHPDVIAAVHGGDELTYRELNTRANRLGNALLDRGLAPEGVVAVVTERNLDWMASVLAVFKAGGVYLPIEPHFPADRIANTLTRAGCELVVTEPGSTETLDQALDSLPGIQKLDVETALAEDHPDDDLGVDVGPNQLAYIYFTSGSTGEPKGAMCEHLGFLNHLYAKIDDFEMGEGEVVAQIAPQCFDISLWQLVSALLVGGRTLIIEQDTILDPKRFVQKIVDGRVGVMQVVPSYLEVLLSYLDQNPHDLPDLHCTSVTGEALTLELAQRWFATNPTIKLANAYGLTETSDDTNHEVMSSAPTEGGVPLGRAVNNVHVYVVDEQLQPVPLGAPGEIVFSGMCVGRGYINDPDRTRLAYLLDPHRDGERLYRSGDFGRWRPDGKLEFLGRRDAQVKIRGFRIEIGEIENTLLRVEGVRQGAVVVTNGADRGQRLIGFYSGRRLSAAELTEHLSRSLPEYMVPSALHWEERLPLTANGKIDRKMLAARAGELSERLVEFEPPSTPAEQQLAADWATVLGVPGGTIGRRDDFFDLGGTSLSAVELVIRLENIVSLQEVVAHTVLADQAVLLDGDAVRRSASRIGRQGQESGSESLKGEEDRGLKRRSDVSLMNPVSSLDLDRRPGRAPVLTADANGDAQSWVAEHRDSVRALVTAHGSLLVRELELTSAVDVAAVAHELADTLVVEREAFASRQEHSAGIYSSSAWPAKQPMCMHHEQSYRLEVPGLMIFTCLSAATSGGAIGVADSHSVLRALPSDLVERFDREGWILTRNYTDEIGLSVRQAFGTDDREAVERYCRDNEIEFEWQADGGLRTSQRRPAVVDHPVTGQRCWFNQIAFLNEWTMNPEVREFLVNAYGPDGLPFNTRFGGGDAIDESIVRLINDTYDAHTSMEGMQAGDLMLVDNIRTSHSREAFEGPRQVLVAMADPVRLTGPSRTVDRSPPLVTAPETVSVERRPAAESNPPPMTRNAGGVSVSLPSVTVHITAKVPACDDPPTVVITADGVQVEVSPMTRAQVDQQ